MATVGRAGNSGKLVRVTLRVYQVRLWNWAAMSRCQHNDQSSIDFREGFTHQDDTFVGHRLSVDPRHDWAVGVEFRLFSSSYGTGGTCGFDAFSAQAVVYWWDHPCRHEHCDKLHVPDDLQVLRLAFGRDASYLTIDYSGI